MANVPGQVEKYLVHRTANLSEEVVEELAADIETLPEDNLESVIDYVEKTVTEVIREFRANFGGVS